MVTLSFCISCAKQKQNNSSYDLLGGCKERKKRRGLVWNSKMGPKKKDKTSRASFTIKDMILWIEEAEKPGVSQVQVAAKFGIRTSTLHNVLKKKAEILAVASTSQKSKHIKRRKEQELEEKVYDWFLKMRSKGLVIDRPLLRKQAKKMAEMMELDTSLTFSAGWLIKWRKHYGIEAKTQHGEQLDADFAASEK